MSGAYKDSPGPGWFRLLYGSKWHWPDPETGHGLCGQRRAYWGMGWSARPPTVDRCVRCEKKRGTR